MSVVLGPVSRPIRTALVAAATAIAVASTTAPAAAQGRLVETYGDWQLRCDTPPGALAERCALLQAVLAEDRENIGLRVIVFQTADRELRLLRVFAPLGIYLPYGLGLQIDGANFGTVEFTRCFSPEGCLAELILVDPVLAQLTAGTTATFIIFPTPEQGLGIPISLAGLADGLGALP